MSCVGDIGGRPQYGLKPGYEKTDKYPYESGDVLVLGPDVIVTRNGDLINWRGENYVRQIPIPVPDPLEEKDEYISDYNGFGEEVGRYKA